MTAQLKRCTKCGAHKPHDQFPLDRRTPGKLDSRCKKCRTAAHRAWREKNKDHANRAERRRYARSPRRYETHVVRKYGITLKRYDEMFAEQDGRCAICRQTSDKRLCVDHDHKTGLVRGLLCRDCNHVLGHAHDNPNALVAAAAYLLRSQGVFA